MFSVDLPEREGSLLNSFLLPIGRSAGVSLPTLLASMSCGAAFPVTGLDILHITDSESDPVIPPMVRDMNRIHSLLSDPENSSLFPSSFVYASCRPSLPALHSLSGDTASSALLGALRGRGIPLSYKTDREAVDWAFSVYLSGNTGGESDPLRAWFGRIGECLSRGEAVRISVLCDLCDPFSAGAAFAVLRYLRGTIGTDPSSLSLFCLGVRTEAAQDYGMDAFSDALRGLSEQNLISRPDGGAGACADTVWILSMPLAMYRSPDSLRILYFILAAQLSRFLSSEKPFAPGLHTVNLPGIMTFQAFGDQGKPFAAFIHASVWLLADLLPAFSAWCSHPAALKSLSANTRNGLFRRLLQASPLSPDREDPLPVLQRALKAVLSEILMMIRHLPDSMRRSDASDPLWHQIVDACGRTVTVASEYDVSLAEAEEGGILDVKPVHRVSMADTEEEKAGRRLEEIIAQLKDEKEIRDRLFAATGGCWTVPALRNCRTRCMEALDRTKEQLERRSGEPEADRLSLAALSRRIRLLEAAIARCESDLADPELIRGGLSGSTVISDKLSAFSGQLLNAGTAEKLSSLLSLSGVSQDAERKEIISLLPELFDGYTLPDVKNLFRQLVAICRPDASAGALPALVLSVLQVCRSEISPLRFLSAGEVPDLPLLPDLWPETPALSVSALLPLLPPLSGQQADPVPEKRGLLAMLLLRQYRRREADEPSLSFDRFSSGDSAVLRAWLSARNADSVWIVSLGNKNDRLPFALILPGTDLIPARFSPSHKAFLPVFAAPWFDDDSLSFRDPCAFLSESDRIILLDRIGSLAEACAEKKPASLLSFLSSFREDLNPERGTPGLTDHLELRLKAAYGLRLLPAFRSSLVRKTVVYERSLPSDETAARLADRPAFDPAPCRVPDDIIYLYRDVPFARENPRTLLDAIPLPAENWILRLLEQECRTLSRASDDYHDFLVRELGLLLDRYPDAQPEARDVALRLLEKAGEPVPDSDTELVWPWDLRSPSVLTILTESLGEALAAIAVQPFSDMLTLFPARGNEVIGDALMASMCVLPPLSASSEQESALMPDAVLPPLSAGFCAALCRLPEGRTLVRSGFLSFERGEGNTIRVILTLEGSFTVRLCRDYAEEEILHLYAHDIPTLAVWPNLPFSPEDWHAYFIYAGLPSSLRISVFNAEGDTLSPAEGGSRVVCRSSSFPLSFSFSADGKTAGSLPNLLPSPVIEKTDPYMACVDFGSVGTSVVFSVGHRRHPLQGPTMVRTLISNPAQSRDLLRKEFLPAVPVSALLPTASRIFRNVPGAAPCPFEDGIVLMSSDLQDVLSIPSGALYTCLKWEEEKGRSVQLCLHQIMLMAALQARSEGASHLTWRFSVPDEMAKAGRERLVSLFTALAEQVRLESGFSLPDKTPPVTFAAESAALGAYFRLCASEDTRGGFMVLDIGACTADISLFLRGREQAVRTCQIPLGIHYMLLPSLLRDPGRLQQDLGYVQDPSFHRDLLLLEQIFRNAKADPSALRHSRLALDSFIADRFSFLMPSLLQNPATGMPTRLGSELLLHFSFLMMLSGLILLQIAADPQKNDFLPEQMSLCLSGRGAILPECLPDQYKTALWHFLTMFRNRRVASLSFLFSSEKKMEIPVGLSVLQDVSADLPPASAVPASISVRPEELLPQFILRFAKEFPASAEILFHGFFTGDFYHPFTPYGESIVSAAISQSFTEQTALRPYDALSSWITSLLELIHTSGI